MTTATVPRRGLLREAVERLAAAVPADLFRWFRISFAIKLFLVAVIRHGTTDLTGLVVLATLAAAAVNMGSRRRYLPGAAIFAVYSLWVVVSRWPFPANHHLFEARVRLLKLQQLLSDVLRAAAQPGPGLELVA